MRAARHPLVLAVSSGAAFAVVTRWCCAVGRRRQLGWQRPAAQTLCRPLAARIVGTGPPIVLLHGLGASGRYWGAAYDRLGVGRRLVVPDLLGFGASPRPEGGYGPDDHAAAVAACLDTLGVNEKAVVGAHSAGVAVALRLAVTRPDLVRAVVAFGPPLYRDVADARRRLRGLGAMARLFANDGRVAEVVCRWVCRHRGAAARLAVLCTPSLPADIVRDGVQHTWGSYSETLTRLVLTSEVSEWLDDVDVPVNLIAGDRDPACDAGWLRTLAARHGHVRFESWNGDHHLPLTHPVAAIRALEDAC